LAVAWNIDLSRSVQLTVGGGAAVNMKAKSFISLGAALVLLCLAASESNAGVSWSVSIFDGPLAACGHWDNRPRYGRCWHPAYVSADWYPYCEGYWMWTDCGWYWVSSEPWAWATYHYGRWAYDPYDGWVWVPDTEWGASWVCWREGGGYCGWAPLPPGAVFGPGGDIVYRNGPVPDRFFVFVQLGHFSEPIHRRDVIVNKTTVINKTVNITKITRVNNVVVNHGPRVDEIQKVSTRKLTEAPPRATTNRGASPRKGALPEVIRPNANGPGRQPVQAEKPNKGEPQVIRGGSGQGGYETKPPGNQHATPLPAVSKPPVERPQHPVKPSAPPQSDHGQQGTHQNFGSGGSSPNSPAAPDSVQPRQPRSDRGQHTSHEPASQGRPSREQRPAQKESQPRSDQGRDGNPKQGQQGGN
jgi:hypothetical protein